MQEITIRTQKDLEALRELLIQNGYKTEVRQSKMNQEVNNDKIESFLNLTAFKQADIFKKADLYSKKLAYANIRGHNYYCDLISKIGSPDKANGEYNEFIISEKGVKDITERLEINELNNVDHKVKRVRTGRELYKLRNEKK